MKLSPKSKKGRERLKRDGAEGWMIIQVKDRVQFSNAPGPWLFIGKTPDGRGNESRWIQMRDDTDFEIVEGLEDEWTTFWEENA